MIAHVDFAIPFILAALPCGLWQAPLFAFAAWLVLRVRPQANATTRHSVLAAAPVASIVLPVFTAALCSSVPPEPATTASAAHPAPKPAAGGSEDAAIPSNIVPYVPRRTSAPQLALKATGIL
jgi:hypothetical protein